PGAVFYCRPPRFRKQRHDEPGAVAETPENAHRSGADVLPSPMSLATAMYHSERDPLHRMSYKSDKIYIPRDLNQRRVQKVFLRYHEATNWPLLREDLKGAGRTDLIGSGPVTLVPAEETAMLKNSKRAGCKPACKLGS